MYILNFSLRFPFFTSRVFKDYLDSDDLVHYNNCVKEITHAFLNVSLTIRAVEDYFRKLNFGETMANLIRQLQLLEKEKLNLVWTIVRFLMLEHSKLTLFFLGVLLS
jgi:hypothetical protein